MKKIRLTIRGVKDFSKLKDFYDQLYGIDKTQDILKSIKSHISILESTNFNFKESGEIDQQFNHLGYEYRKLIHRHCKITYREGNEFIYVVRVFDMRQDPNKNL